MTIHLIKLAVGVESIAHLAEIQATRLEQARNRGEEPTLRHITRNTPRRTDELLAGGSLYWVVKGSVRVRQRLLDIARGASASGRPSCALELDPQLVPVEIRGHRPFQGWRYLGTENAPPDTHRLPEGAEGMPPVAAELRALGLL